MRMSISGIQMKLSVRIDPETWRVETVSEGGTHILKPEPGTFAELPHNENLCMNMASTLGLNVPPHGLFAMADGTFCYIVKRFDRLENGKKLPKETFFQISGQENKYAGSLESLGKIIRLHATRTGLDALDFFERVLFCYLIGNGDMHQKNWALLTDPQRVIKLAPCYDFVSSKVYLPDESDSALTVNGKHHGLTRKDFEVLATSLRIDPKASQFTFKKFSSTLERLITFAQTSTLSPVLREKLIGLIQERHRRLFTTLKEG
jgi:serine/threonine-protein kinase HipA